MLAEQIFEIYWAEVVYKDYKESKENIERVRATLVRDLPFLHNTLKPNEMYNLFFNKFYNLINSIFTPKSVLKTDAIVFREWATVELHKNGQK
ncbi:unnamed protein product, partial [Leptidea sinapis]